MKTILAALFFVLTTFSWGQIDSKRSAFKLGLGTSIPREGSDNSSNATIEYESIFSKDKSLQRYSILKTEKEAKSILDTSTDFANPGEEYKKRLKRKTRDKKIDESFKQNQFLGKFSTATQYLKIVCRDHEYPDGDRVSILVNDVVVIPQILLESGSKEYYLQLGSGFNKIEFLALNQGTSGPNTAAFSVYNDKGVLITTNEWNLTTGVKAKIVVINKEPEK